MFVSATSLGDALRQERLRNQLTLARIARETCIRVAILEAIEEDRFDCMPGGSYRRHFLRQYARALGLDGDAVIAEFKKHHEEPPLPLPIPPRKRRSRFWAELAWAIVVIASLTATYEAAENVLDAAKRHQPPAERTAPQLTTERELPASIAPAATKPASQKPVVAVHVSFMATEPVWVSVKCDGNATYAGLLDAPESRTFNAAGVVTALIGNAGGLQVSVNGEPVGSLGAHGEVEMIEVTMNGARRIPRPTEAAGASAAPQL